MRLLFVVQRYGAEVAGGAESLAEMMARRLVGRGHEVTVLTSCAVDYATWADEYPPGTEIVDGVRVVRLGAVAPRDPDRFGAVTARVVPSPGRPVPAMVDEAWMYEQGPVLAGFDERLLAELADHDAVVCFTYLYATTARACTLGVGRIPVIIHPTAHEEWPLRLPRIRQVIDAADGIACSTPEELALVNLRFRPAAPAEVVGIGFAPPEAEPDVAAFRARFGLGDDPYLLCLGRIDPNKGTSELIEFAARSRRLEPLPPLVLGGAQMTDIPDRTGLVLTGFLDDADRWAALAGASVVLQPSRQESFGMTLAEAWTVGTPVMVQRDCAVTAGLVQRSGGGIAYSTPTDFDAALRLLLEDASLRADLAERGRRFVEANYRWDVVLDRYESLLAKAVDHFHQLVDLGTHPG